MLAVTVFVADFLLGYGGQPLLDANILQEVVHGKRVRIEAPVKFWGRMPQVWRERPLLECKHCCGSRERRW